MSKEFVPKDARRECLVTYAAGDMPVLLTAAHGGKEIPGDIAMPRSEYRGYKVRDTETFSIQVEENTRALVFRLAEKIKQKIKRKPYIITADFSREYIDAGRNNLLLGPAAIPHENHAYDDPEGKKYYDFYHLKMRQFIDDIRSRFNSDGLLFDFHGSIYQENKIVVGMVTYDATDFQRYFRRGHVSVDRLISRYGVEPLYHPNSGFLSVMHGNPLPGGRKTEVVPMDRFQRASPSGGFVVINYGSNRHDGIDAFQIDCSTKLRTQWLRHTVEIISDAIQTLYRNVIGSPYVIEPVFAGNSAMGTKKGENRNTVFRFSLEREPQKGHPSVIMIHCRRPENIPANTQLTLNDHFLGHMEPGKWVTVIETDNKGWGKLRRNKNTLAVTIREPEDETSALQAESFEIMKIDVVYCST